MAYNLHITRQKEWNIRDPELEISEADWTTLLNEHTELESSDSIKANGFELFDSSMIAKWATNTGKNVWLTFSKGNITVSLPDEDTIRKMKEIATSLNAKVQGDDGELY